MKVKYLGHASFCITSGKSVILIDPVLDASKTSNIKPTHVIVTHAHQSHAGNVLDYLKNGATLISFSEICNFFKQKDSSIKVSPHNFGGFVQYDDFFVEFVYALHSSSFDGITSNGVAGGVVLKVEGKYLYHAGDTGVFGDMELIGKLHHIHAAFLPIGSRSTMDIDDAIYAVSLIRPHVAIPMSYDTTDTKVDPQEFIRKLPSGVDGVVFDVSQEHEC